MFRYIKDPVIWWPVTIRVPVDDGVEAQTCRVKYRLLTSDEMTERSRDLLTVLQASNDIDKVMGMLSQEELAKRRKDLMDKIVDYDIVDAETDAPLPFTRENLEALLKLPFVVAAFAEGLNDASQGAAIKNSETPPTAGSAAENPSTSPPTT